MRGPKSEFLKAKCLEPFFKNVLPTEGGEHIFENKKKVARKMQAKWHLEACIFDANSQQGPWDIIFLQLARRWLVFFENHIIQVHGGWGRPGGMRGGAGGRFEGG